MDNDTQIENLIKAELESLGTQLPTGSELEFGIVKEILWLELFKILPENRGCGTDFFSQILSIADRYGMTTRLHADPSDEPGDPSTYDLVRWYTRFDYAIIGLNDQEWIIMERTPKPYRNGKASILEDYAVRRENDLSQSQFEKLQDALISYRHIR